MEKNCKVEEVPSDSGSESENKEKEIRSTGVSPLAASLFLSPPSNTETNYSVGKLIRCTSTPSYSSIFGHGNLELDLKDPLFTANIQLEQEEEQPKTRIHVKDIPKNDPNHDSVIGSYNEGHSLFSCSNESDTSSTNSSRGKHKLKRKFRILLEASKTRSCTTNSYFKF